MKSKNDKNDLDFGQNEQHLFLRGRIDARFHSLSSLMNTCSLVGLCFASNFSMRYQSKLGKCSMLSASLQKKAVDDVKARSLPHVPISKFNVLSGWLLYRLLKY